MQRFDGIGGVYGVALIALGLIVLSLAGTVIGSLAEPGQVFGSSFQNYKDVFTDETMPGVIWRTIVLGLGTVFTTMLFGLPLAWILGRSDYRHKTLLFSVLTAKLAIPGFITAMAYVWLLNPSSGLINQLLGATSNDGVAAFDIYQLSWVCFLQGIVLVPGAVFMLLPAMRNLDASLEEAALVSGVKHLQVFRYIVAPLLAPAVLAVAVFYFIIAVEMFDFVAIIGIGPGAGEEVLVLRIYRALTESAGLPEYGLAGVLGMILFGLCIGAIIIYVRLLKNARRFAVVGGKRRMMAPARLGPWHKVATLLAVMWFIFSVGLPVITLIWVTLTPFFQPPSAEAFATVSLDGFRDGLSYMGDALINTAIVMVGAMTVAMTFAISMTWVVTRSKSQFGMIADGAVFLAPAVPTVVSATAFQIVGIAVYAWLPLYGTLWIVILAMGTRMLTYSTRTMNSAALQLAPELEEAAWTSGVSKFTTFRHIFVPLMAPAIFYAALMVGMLAARDLTLPLIMSSGQNALISVLIFDLQTNGEYNSAAAIGLYMIVVLVALAVFARRMTGISEPGADHAAQQKTG